MNSVFFIALLLLSFSTAQAQAPTSGETPKAPPYQWPRSHNYDVQHYRIQLAFDWAARSVTGATTITLKPLAGDFKEIEIDAGEMTIKSVNLAGGPPLKFDYRDNEKLFVSLDRAYTPANTIAVTISYSATPKKGLTFILPTESDPGRPRQIWSQGEARTNHYWFPCYDYPNDKATSELIATVEDNYRVISNGVLVSTAPEPKKKMKTWRWSMNQPFSSYLVSIIVGEYAEIPGQFKGKPVASYVYPDQVENGRLSLGKLPQMVAFFSEKLGYDYPYPKYVQTMVRDFGGAMENITATTMTDTAVHDKRAHIDVSSDEIEAHELAHQWFGNLLTCRDWGEIWLNESFATFMEAVWNESEKGRDDYLYEMYNNQQSYYQTWARGSRRPIVTKRYEDPDALFDVYAYPRGGAVLNMLRFTLGEEQFWKAIRHYVKKYEWQNVETAQLIIAIEEATGQNLGWFFDEWIYKMGHPEFEIASTYDGAKTLKLTVKQTQKLDNKQPWFPSTDVFITPVDIAITTAAGEKTHRVLIDQPEEHFTFDVDSKPLIVNFDRGNQLIKTVKFDRSDDELAYQALRDADSMGRVRAAIELRAKRGETGAKALIEAAVKDSFWAVRLEAVKSLAEYKTDASRAGLLEAVKDKNSKVRRAAIAGLANFKDKGLAELFTSVINSDPSYYVVVEAAKALGQTEAPGAFDTLSALLKQDSWQDTIRGGALNGIAALKNPSALEIGLKYAAPGNRASLRGTAFQLLATVGKGDERALKTLTDALKDTSPQILFGAVQAIGVLGDPRATPALEEFLKNLPPGIPEGVARQFVGELI
ncbi:MAG TPA: M1 family aminopeptidase, partial [Blastocatellia bacterium]